VNAPNLSRRLASRIVDGLKGRGRILVVKGGTAALVRVVDDAMAGSVDQLVERIARSPSSLEDPTTTDALARLSGRVAQALLASEHLEDVFADRSVVERDTLEAARAVLREASAAADEELVRVELDLLGYVAATAGKRARGEVLSQALVRAGDAVGARLEGYDPATREAIFLPEPPVHPDLRLELEEAVADELSALVQRGAVELPTLERTAPLVHDVSPSERARLSRLIDRAATRTLRRTGCSARWEIPDGRSVRVIFTPLSEQDARDVDVHVATFAREVDTVLADAGTPLAGAAPAPAPAPRPEARLPSPPALPPRVAEPEPMLEVKPSEEEPEAVEESASAEPATPKPARARTTTKRTTRAPSRPSTTVRATTKKRAPAPKRTTTKRTKATTEEAPRAKKAVAPATKRARPAATKTRPAKKR
jgi:hypothetical protein